MPTERIHDDVIDFLRREAPTELQRLQSIARLVRSRPGHFQSRPQPRNTSYEAWLEATFGIFGAQKDIETAKN
jgi:hypothetical protein